MGETASDTQLVVARGVVLVVARSASLTKVGSGFVVPSNGSGTQILTADHAVENASDIVIVLDGNLNEQYEATVVRRDALRDIALLQISVKNRFALVQARPGKGNAGTPVAVVGYPGRHQFAWQGQRIATAASDLRPVVVFGNITGTLGDDNRIFFDAPIDHGDSGAPIVDVSDNEVVGMAEGGAFSGSGFEATLNGNAVGLATAGFASILNGLPKGASAPSFQVAVAAESSDDSGAGVKHQLVDSVAADLAQQNDFIAVPAPAPRRAYTAADVCKSAKFNAVLFVHEQRVSENVEVGLALADCSAAAFYDVNESGPVQPLGADAAVAVVSRMAEKRLLGFVDANRGRWQSLLRYGIAVDPASPDYESLLTFEDGPFGGVLIKNVFSRGPGDVAGLRAGDFVETIGGKPVRSAAEVRSLINRPSYKIVVDRRDRRLILNVQPRRFRDLVLSLTGKAPEKPN